MMHLRYALTGTIAALALAVTNTASAELSDLGFRWMMPVWLAPPPEPDDNPMTAEKGELGRNRS